MVCFFIWTQATCHAELEAINECVRRGTLERLRGCDLFVTCEPCIMCAQALRIIGIGHVYYGCRNPRFGGNGSVVAVHSTPFVSFSLPFFCTLSVPMFTKMRCVCSGLAGNCYESEGGCCEEEAVRMFRAFFAMSNPDGLLLVVLLFSFSTSKRVFICVWNRCSIICAAKDRLDDSGMLEVVEGTVPKRPRTEDPSA